MKQKQMTFKNKEGEKLVGILEHNTPSDTLVIACHGFASSKNQVLIREFCKRMVQAGFHALRFDFSGNGESEGEFGDASYLKEKEDLESVLTAISKKYKKIFVAGHSMGGAVVLLAAAGNKKISGVIYLAGVAFPKKVIDGKYSKDAAKKFREQKKSLVIIAEKQFPLNKKFFQDLDKVDVIKAAQQVTAPLLIVHGALDRVIPSEQSEAVYAVANEPKEMHIIPDENHAFSKHTIEVTQLVEKWIKTL